MPITRFLDDAVEPDGRLGAAYADRERWLLKPLFSFAGGGIMFAPTDDQIAAIPAAERSTYVLQERVAFTPVIETPLFAVPECEMTRSDALLKLITGWLKFTANETLDGTTITASDFTFANVTGAPTITGSGTSFTITVTPTGDGAVTIAPSGTFSVADLAANATTTTVAGSDRSVTYDSIAPTLTLAQAAGQADPTNVRSVRFTLSANEVIDASTVTSADFSVSDGTIDSIACSGTPSVCVITVSAIADGTVTIGLAPAAGFSVIGAPFPRVDGRAKVTGSAAYTADIAVPGMLHGAVVGSPVPHGRIIAIDAADALAARVKQADVEFIYYQFATINGRILAKMVPAAHLRRSLEKAISLIDEK